MGREPSSPSTARTLEHTAWRWGRSPAPPPQRLPGLTAVGLSLILASLAAAACGAAPASPAPVSPTVSATLLTNADDGRTVGLAIGDSLVVILVQQAGYMPWQAPMSSDSNVLQRAPSESSAASAVFKAVHAGRADLTSFEAFACSPGANCPALARVWRVTVNVS